jgi:enoyl-[acyl-carrier protein] reductase I
VLSCHPADTEDIQTLSLSLQEKRGASMGLFEGKRGLITGVFNKQSIAWAIAERIMREGGECGFSYMPDKPDDQRKKNLNRITKLTEGNPQVKFLQPMDVTQDEQIEEVMERCSKELGQIDFLLHSIAYAPPTDLKGDTIDTSRDGFKLAMEISAYSLIALANAAQKVLNDDASILTLTYFGGEKTVPGYNVMGICKAALDSTVGYLAFDLGTRGIRVNALSAGPMQTISGRGAGVEDMLDLYSGVAPLGRNINHEEVAKSGTFLLSDMSSGITGEILHLDGGYNSMGSPGRLVEQFKS